MRLYPRIPHLPGSRATADDRHAALAQAALYVGGDAEGQGPRARGPERVLVTEKLDGTCVAIARRNGEVVALGREGRRCAESPNAGRLAFAAWVAAQPARWEPVREGEHVLCEWLALAHTVRYQLPHEPAVVIDGFVDGRQLTLQAVRARAATLGLPAAALLHEGEPWPLAHALAALGARGHHGAIDDAEGVVYRRERRRDGAVLGLAKFVRPGFEPGRYLPDQTGGAPVWNGWRGPWSEQDARDAAGHTVELPATDGD